jgi:S-(hydroxymethyl)glutathione dehydrogenase/alcohol dehydrogenase
VCLGKNIMQSQAIITRGKGDFEQVTLEIGNPGPQEVLIQMKAASLCHTDWDSLSWGEAMVLGHEGAGVVQAIGCDVKRVKVGDAVVLNWAIPCGQCSCCSSGSRNICEINSPVTGTMSGHAHGEACIFEGQPLKRSFHLGTLSEYTIVRQEAVVPFQEKIPFSSATLMGCGVMTGYGSVINAAKIQAGECIAIIGCGGVGLNAIQAASIAGARCIVAIDRHESRLEQAKKFGATHGLVASTYEKMRSEIKFHNSGIAADVAIECTAIPELGDAPLALIRNGGRAIQASGIEQNISFNCELFEWDKTYLNPLYGQCDPDRDFPRLISHYLAGRLKLDEQVSATWKLSQIKEAFEALLSGKGAKNVIEFSY